MTIQGELETKFIIDDYSDITALQGFKSLIIAPASPPNALIPIATLMNSSGPTKTYYFLH